MEKQPLCVDFESQLDGMEGHSRYILTEFGIGIVQAQRTPSLNRET